MFLSDGQVVPANVDTLADENPLFADRHYYAPASGLNLTGLFQSYSQLYRRQLWVGILIRKLSFGVARLPFELAEPDGNLAALLAKPSPRMSAFALWRWTRATRDIYGEAFWLKVRDERGRVRELHPLNPSTLTIRRNLAGELVYMMTRGVGNAPLLEIPEADVVPFTAFSPDTLARGMSNLEGLRQTLLNEDAARRASESFWRRGARPGFALTSPKTLSDAAQKRLRDQMDKTHAGADQWGATAVFEEGLTPTILQLSAEEMQYIESRKLNREEVCASYDMPPPAVHILDHATFSNITEQMRSVYRDTMTPPCAEMEAVVTQYLLPDFPDEGPGRFNMNEVLRGDFEARSTATVALVQTGIARPREGRDIMGFPDDAGPVADELYANAALQPLGSSPAAPAPAVATDGSLIPTPLRVVPAPRPATASYRSNPAYRAIIGRLSRVKADKGATRRKLEDEHRAALSGYFGEQRDKVVAALSTKAAALPADVFDDESLAGVLVTLSQASVDAIGGHVAKNLDGTFDAAELQDWIDKNATDSAKAINASVRADLETAITDAEDQASSADDWYAANTDSRTEQMSITRVTMLAGLAGLAAARQSSAKTKTWELGGGKPRPSHVAMSGETVPLGELFSNGMNGPGDPAGGADEVAGCSCDLSFGKE